jgi:hypothetical protein
MPRAHVYGGIQNNKEITGLIADLAALLPEEPAEAATDEPEAEEREKAAQQKTPEPEAAPAAPRQPGESRQTAFARTVKTALKRLLENVREASKPWSQKSLVDYEEQTIDRRTLEGKTRSIIDYFDAALQQYKAQRAR